MSKYCAHRNLTRECSCTGQVCWDSVKQPAKQVSLQEACSDFLTPDAPVVVVGGLAAVLLSFYFCWSAQSHHLQRWTLLGPCVLNVSGTVFLSWTDYMKLDSLFAPMNSQLSTSE